MLGEVFVRKAEGVEGGSEKHRDWWVRRDGSEKHRDLWVRRDGSEKHRDWWVRRDGSEKHRDWAHLPAPPPRNASHQRSQPVRLANRLWFLLQDVADLLAKKWGNRCTRWYPRVKPFKE